MATEHSTLTGANLHEPKGAASALTNQVYVANGAGGGAWTTKLTMGFADYNDVTTTGTPITVVGGAGFVALTNDEAGAGTNKTYLPTGVTDVWDSATNKFDWTELALGDVIDIRLDIDIIIATTNTEVEVVLELADGSGGDYNIQFINATNFKTAATFKEVAYNGIYMGNTNTLNNPGFFKIKADKTCTVVVNGWYVKVVKR